MSFPLPSPTLDPNFLALARFARETRTGSTSATWTLENRVLNGFELIFKNGTLLEPTTGYTLDGKVVTFVAAIIAGDVTTAVYYFVAA